MFSIIVPTFNNLNYLKILLQSIKKNSTYKHDIIVHVNEGSDGTVDYLNKEKIKYTHTKKNVGLCSGVNIASKEALTNYILYTHDDMYFCPNWDKFLESEIDSLNTNAFYISGTMIEKNGGHIQLDCGEVYNNFDEEKLLNRFNELNYNDHQGSHWAPHIIHKDYWNRVGGFSEEFNPGIGSDPDLNMKLWNAGVRIFKGVGKFRVYHFGSVVLRKKTNFVRNKGSKTFLIKWGITPKFFVKYYLRGGKFKKGVIVTKKYDGPLKKIKFNSFYLFELLICKVKFFFTKVFN